MEEIKQGTLLQQIRQYYGVSQKKLAQHIGVSHGYLSNLENSDKKIPSETLYKCLKGIAELAKIDFTEDMDHASLDPKKNIEMFADQYYRRYGFIQALMAFGVISDFRTYLRSNKEELEREFDYIEESEVDLFKEVEENLQSLNIEGLKKLKDFQELLIKAGFKNDELEKE